MGIKDVRSAYKLSGRTDVQTLGKRLFLDRAISPLQTKANQSTCIHGRPPVDYANKTNEWAWEQAA